MNENEEKQQTLIGGVDEAGRGSIIGPMIISFLAIDETKLPLLVALDIRDSKLLTSRKRERLFYELLGIADIIIVAVVPPVTIDRWVSKHKYNALEATAIAQILGIAPKLEKYYIDAPSNPKNFRTLLEKQRVNLRNAIIENHADRKYLIVGAASIIAKVLRDSAIKIISQKTKIDIGSGYPSDPRTQSSLQLLLRMYPEIVRKSWKTLKNRGLIPLDTYFKKN